MQVKRFDDPAAFLARAEPLLLSDEARHNLMLGIAGNLRDQPGLYLEFRGWTVEDEGRAVGAALQTPPYNLVVASPEVTDALAVLAGALADHSVELPGVTAALPEVDTFADAWLARAGGERRPRMRQRIYRLTAVRPVAGIRGSPQKATDADRDLLLDWIRAFAEESFRDVDPKAAARQVDARLDGEPAGSRSGTTRDPCRSPAGEARHRTASGSARSTRRRACAGAGTRAHSRHGCRPISLRPGTRSASSTPTSRIRPRTASTWISGTSRSAIPSITPSSCRAPQLRARAVHSRGDDPVTDRLRPLWDFDDLEASEQRFRAALAEEPDAVRRAEILTQLARVHGLRGEFESGEQLLAEAEAIGGASDRCTARIDLERGRLLRSGGDPDAAYPLFESAFETATAAGELFIAGDAAHMAAIAGPPRERMLAWTERGVELAESGDGSATYWLGPLLNNLGWDQYEAGEYDAALSSFERALAARERDPANRAAIVIARYAVAKTLRTLGRPAEAASAIEPTVAWTQGDGKPDGWVHEELAEIYAALGREADAREHAGLALSVLPDMDVSFADDERRVARLRELAGVG